MSSNDYKDTADIGGIFDSDALDDDSTIWVNVPYCSSDGHMGNTDNSDLGYEFRGHEIIKAVLQTTKDRWGVGSEDLVVFGGASAGARGAMVHLDFVANFFNESEVLGVLDSPLWVDLDPPYWTDEESLLKQTAAVYDLAGVGDVSGPDGVVTDDCLSAHKGEEEYKCLFGEYRIPFVRPPHLLVSAQFDSFQLEEDGLSLPFDDESNAYATLFGKKMHSVFGDLAAGSKDATFYSQPCYNHAISMSSKYFTAKGDNGMTLDDAFKAFLGSLTGFTDLTSYCDKGFSACTADDTKCSGE